MISVVWNEQTQKQNVMWQTDAGHAMMNWIVETDVWMNRMDFKGTTKPTQMDLFQRYIFIYLWKLHGDLHRSCNVDRIIVYLVVR